MGKGIRSFLGILRLGLILWVMPSILIIEGQRDDGVRKLPDHNPREQSRRLSMLLGNVSQWDITPATTPDE